MRSPQPQIVYSIKNKMSLFHCGFHEAHFSGLLGQSNVYGLSNVILPDGTAKILVSRSPHKEKVLCLEYIKEKGNLRPISREVQFAYIPGKKSSSPQLYCLFVYFGCLFDYPGQAVLIILGTLHCLSLWYLFLRYNVQKKYLCNVVN